MAVNGVGLATLGVGVAFAWGGLTGRSPLQAVRVAVAGSAPSTVPITGAVGTISPASLPSGAGTGATGGIAAVVNYAEAQVGKPYVFGAVGPDSFDCSGLIVAAYKQIGVTLPHFTGAMIVLGTKVERANLAVGDLVFPDYHHVQLYVGGGMICEAAESGIPVRVVPMWGYYTARRVYNGN